MSYANYTSTEVVERGEAIFQREIRQKVASDDTEKFLVLNIETGEYEIDAEDAQARHGSSREFLSAII
jgi:hypothetical protein